MKTLTVVFFLIFVAAAASAQQQAATSAGDWRTPAERSDYRTTPR